MLTHHHRARGVGVLPLVLHTAELEMCLGFCFGIASPYDGFPQSDLHEQKVYEDSCIHKLFGGRIIEFDMCLSKNSVSYFWMGRSGYESRDVHESVSMCWQVSMHTQALTSAER